MMRMAAILAWIVLLGCVSAFAGDNYNVYFNAQRGYEAIGADKSGNVAKPFFLPCMRSEDVEFEVRAEGCGFVLRGMRGDSVIEVRLRERKLADPFGMAYVRNELQLTMNGVEMAARRESGRLPGDMRGSKPSTLRVRIRPDGVGLDCDGYKADYAIAGFATDSVGVVPGVGGLRVVRGHLVLEEPVASRRQIIMTEEDIENHLRRSQHALTGQWEVLDRDLEEDLLRLGGAYRLAIVEGEDGAFSMLYLSGAEINPDEWHPGMLKGMLHATDVGGIYDCEWIDAQGRSLSYSVKAEHDAAMRTLTIKFPYHGSTLRLIRTR